MCLCAHSGSSSQRKRNIGTIERRTFIITLATWSGLKNMSTALMLRFAPHKIVHEISSFCYICFRHEKCQKRRSQEVAGHLLSWMFTVNFLKQKVKQVVAG